MSAERQSVVKPAAAGLSGARFGMLQRKCACGGSSSKEGECEECKQKGMSLQRRAAGGGTQAAVPPVVHDVLRLPGQPLDSATRAFMEPRFGHDFSRVRVHADGPGPANTKILPAGDSGEIEAERLSDSIMRAPEGRSAFDFSRIRIHADGAAADSARAIDALAYTAGHHIVFGAGLYRPHTADGQRLLAHELVHTVQQTGCSGVVQRQGTGTQAAVTVRAIFPYPEKSRLLVNRLLSDTLMDLLATLSQGNPDSALAVDILRASEGQIATVKTATDDLFEAIIPSVALPGQANAPAKTVNNVTLRFNRQPDGTFRVALVADTGSGTKELFSAENFTARKQGADFELSRPKTPPLTVSRGAGPGQVEVVGENPITQLDEGIRLTKLPDAPAGSEAEKKVVAEVTKAARQQRQELSGRSRAVRQEVTAGGGVQLAAGRVDPVLTAAWRANFTPFVKLGGAVQVPLRVEIDYAPDKSLLAGVSSGVSATIPTKLPVNVRLGLGVAGGEVRGAPPPGGGKGPLTPAFGPTGEVGVGIALGKTFRVEVDYQHLQNVARNSPNADTITAGAGVAF
jgi:hypothetical protein